jgi:Domain of unknown function (DUF4145)
MYIERNHFLKNNFPRFNCPTCDKGQLRLIENTFSEKHPAWINKLPTFGDHISYDEDGNEVFGVCYENIVESIHEELIYTCWLECDNKNCKENIASIGMVKFENDYIVNSNELIPDIIIQEYLYPSSFIPTVDLFTIPKTTPESVKKAIKESFKLFWVSAPASANALRVALERLMDEFNIAEISLHKRIEAFKTINNDLSKLLLAIKWIGNDGSHNNDLKDTDVVIGYELIQKCLIDLYKPAIIQLEVIAEKINSSKLPISKINDENS